MTLPDPRLAPAVSDLDRKVARVVLAVALAGTAWFVWRTPPVRRLALAGARFLAFTWLPAQIMRQAREAWDEAGRAVGPVPPIARGEPGAAARR